MERGLVGSPGALIRVEACVASVHPISYFKMPAVSRSKFHVTVSHTTVMAHVVFFSPPARDALVDSETTTTNTTAITATPPSGGGEGAEPAALSPMVLSGIELERKRFDLHKEYLYDEEMRRFDGQENVGASSSSSSTTPAPSQVDDDSGEGSSSSLPLQVAEARAPYQFAVLVFEQPIVVPHDALLIASRLDTDIRCVHSLSLSLSLSPPLSVCMHVRMCVCVCV